MISEYVLLCAPYRFSQDYLNSPSSINKYTVENELFSAIMPGTNMVTRKLILLGLKNNFDIVDKHTLIGVADDLHFGNYHAVSNVDSFINNISDKEQKDILSELNSMTKGRGVQGFDDCRIIDVITKSYAGKLINEIEFNDIFNNHCQRIKDAYESWEQYLASCVLGKIMQLCDESFTIVSKEEFIFDIYYYCITPINIFSYSKFWNDCKLDNLRVLLEKLLEIDKNEAKGSNFSQEICTEDSNSNSLNSPSSTLLNAVMDTDMIDYDKYSYLSDLANYAIWTPIIENELQWMFVDEKDDNSYFLMPKEYLCIFSAQEFWPKYQKLSEIENDNIFAIFDGITQIKAIFTEKGVYNFKKKLFGKATLNHISWKDADLKCKFDIISGISILLDNKTIFEVLYPDFEMIGLTKKDIKSFSDKQEKEFIKTCEDKLNNVLKNIPKKIEEFKKTQK